MINSRVPDSCPKMTGPLPDECSGFDTDLIGHSKRCVQPELLGESDVPASSGYQWAHGGLTERPSDAAAREPIAVVFVARPVARQYI